MSNSRNNMKKRDNVTALYLRVSSEDKDRDESYSVENQRKYLYDVASKLDLSNFREYIDDGISGAKRDRKQFLKMQDDIEKGEISVVMVKDLSRLARDYIKAGILVEEFFPTYDVRLIAPGDSVDTINGENEIIPFKNLLNEYYARDISKKRKATNIVKSNAGESLSLPPYGYIKNPDNPKRWIIDEEAAEVVRRIYDMYLNGFGIEQISSTLAKEKVLTPFHYMKTKGINRGGTKYADRSPYHWQHSTVAKILSVQEYCGDILNFKTYSKSFKLKDRIKNSVENMKIHKDAHEPVIDRATWEKVQSKRGNTRKRIASDGVKNIFSGFLVCPDCGGNLNFHFNQRNHAVQYFNCANNNRAIKTCPTTHHVRVEFLEQVILQEIRRLTAFARLYENEFVKMVTGFSKQAAESDIKRKEKDLNKLTSRNKEIDKLFERLYEDNVNGKINDERYYKMSANYEAEQAENSKRIKQLREELQREHGQQYAAADFISTVKKYTEPTEVTQIMLSELIEKIEVYHAEKINGQTVQRLDIYYNCMGEIEIPDFPEVPISTTKINARKGVDVIYSPNKPQAV